MGVHTVTSTTPGHTDILSVLPKDGKPWWKQRHLVQLNLSLALIFMLSGCNGYDGNIMNNFQTLPQWKAFMNYPTGAWLGFINAVYWIGVLIMSPIVAFVTNKVGRKRTLYTGYVYLAVAVAVQASAKNSATFIASRFILGLTCATFGNVAPLLMAESAYPTHRGIVTSLYQTGHHMGGIVSAWTVFGTKGYDSYWSWRIPAICQIACPMVALIGIYISSESPRWLMSVGREDEALQVLAKLHAGGDRNSPLVLYEFEQIKITLKLEQEAARHGYAEMIRTKGNRHRLFITITIALFAECVGNNVAMNYLSLVLTSVGITDVTHQTLISGCLSIWTFLVAATAAFNVDRFGRRKLLLTSFGIMLVAFCAFTACSAEFQIRGTAAAAIAVVAFMFLFFGGFAFGLNPLLIGYPVEIWQYELRSRGLSACWLTVVIAVIFNVFVNPIAMQAIGWKYYIVFIFVIILFRITTYFFYPETTGHTLEEIKILFDGKSAEEISGVALGLHRDERAIAGTTKFDEECGDEKKL